MQDQPDADLGYGADWLRSLDLSHAVHTLCQPSLPHLEQNLLSSLRNHPDLVQVSETEFSCLLQDVQVGRVRPLLLTASRQTLIHFAVE